jgi:hypothetical protein
MGKEGINYSSEIRKGLSQIRTLKVFVGIAR